MPTPTGAPGGSADEPVRTLTVDGARLTITGPPHATLLDELRAAGYTAPKASCRRGECGACTVLVDGRAIMACTTLAALVSADVTTAAGLGEACDDLRAAFADHAAFQCGFCTPGQVVRAEAVLRENPHRSRDEITRAMAGNVCRCTGYRQIVDAVCAVAQSRRQAVEAGA
ncbi:2Fe-2S iron-sulfur cluster-binding protein [Dactylosporangium sp. NPDC051484]|uniref:(2Fe-2S)-binding protein n=1 Tax=Dactylosporangium sp. NPDC051484 TaxID=3154942 RepID=UPI00344C408B